MTQQRAAVRVLFDWLITGQVVPSHPAAAVRSPKYVVTTSNTPVLDGPRLCATSATAPSSAPLTYSLARIGAAIKMKVEDLRAGAHGLTD